MADLEYTAQQAARRLRKSATTIKHAPLAKPKAKTKKMELED